MSSRSACDERPAVGARRKFEQSVQVVRLRFHAHPLHAPERVVHPLEVVADRLHRDRIVARLGLGEIGVPQSEDDRRGADFFVRRPQRVPDSRALALQLRRSG